MFTISYLLYLYLLSNSPYFFIIIIIVIVIVITTTIAVFFVVYFRSFCYLYLGQLLHVLCQRSQVP